MKKEVRITGPVEAEVSVEVDAFARAAAASAMTSPSFPPKASLLDKIAVTL